MQYALSQPGLVSHNSDVYTVKIFSFIYCSLNTKRAIATQRGVSSDNNIFLCYGDSKIFPAVLK